MSVDGICRVLLIICLTKTGPISSQLSSQKKGYVNSFWHILKDVLEDKANYTDTDSESIITKVCETYAKEIKKKFCFKNQLSSHEFKTMINLEENTTYKQ